VKNLVFIFCFPSLFWGSVEGVGKHPLKNYRSFAKTAQSDKMRGHSEKCFSRRRISYFESLRFTPLTHIERGRKLLCLQSQQIITIKEAIT
jgi:hypothetical protein